MSHRGSLLMRLAELLLREPRWTNRAEVADAMGVSQGALTPWFNYLEFFRAVGEREGGLEIRSGALLATMARVRGASLRPERPRRFGGDASDLRARLDEAGVPHVFAMFTAADRWAFYEPPRDIHVYVERGNLRTLHDIVDARAERGRGAPGALQVYVESLAGLAHQERGGLQVTSPLQTVVDLRAHPEGGAHADFLERNLLPRLQGREGP